MEDKKLEDTKINQELNDEELAQIAAGSEPSQSPESIILKRKGKLVKKNKIQVY